MARPTKLDLETIDKIARAVEVGIRPARAAQAIGIARSTYFDWLKRGRAPGPGDHLYVELLKRIDTAQGSAYAQLIVEMRRHCQRDYRACLALLQHLDKNWAEAAGIKTAAAEGTQAPTINIVVEGKEPTRSDQDAARSGEVEADDSSRAAQDAARRAEIENEPPAAAVADDAPPNVVSLETKRGGEAVA